MAQRKTGLEGKVDKGSVNLQRVAWTAIGYGATGAFVRHPFLGAALGCGLALYDELREKDTNLVVPPVCFAAGGIVGSFIGMGSLGAYLGGAAGLYFAHRDTKK